MTTRTRTAILLLALGVAAFMLCGCDDVAEFITGDAGANRAHYNQVHGTDDNVPGYVPTATPPAERTGE